MTFREALQLALREGIKTMHRDGRPESHTILHPMGFFRDGSNLEKVFTHEDMLATDWEAA